MTEPEKKLKRIALIYNTDYDDELIAESGVDVSAVEEAAKAVCAGVAECGYETRLIGVHGHDLGGLIAGLQAEPPDLVFNLCESMSGDVRNEVVLPSVLDMMGIGYTGPGPLTILLCLHKERSKEVLLHRGISTPAHRLLAAESDLAQLDELDYPFFLKLAHEDASIGIEAANVVHSSDALVTRTRAMWERYKQPVIAERYIDGREVNVTVIGDQGDLGILPLHEIDFGKMPPGRPRIVSYAAKWDENHVDYAGTKPVPMKDLSPELERSIADTAKAAFVALGLRDFGRVDLRIDSDGTPWVIDINPNCDLSPDAGVARAAQHAGLNYPALVGKICNIAWRRHVSSLSRTHVS